MRKKRNINLRNWIDSASEFPSEELDSLWKISGKYKSGYKPDVEHGLTRLKNRMNQRQQTASVLNTWSSRRQWMRLAATIALVLSIAFVWKFYFQNQDITDVTAANEQRELFLEDGTIIILNQNSRLVYPISFDGDTERVVKLTGEAYFKVARNAAQPFVIQTPESSVRVLGTSFNLRAYPGESFTEVEVESGKVEFKVKPGHESVQLIANEKGYYTHGIILEKRVAPSLNAQAWRTGALRFKEFPLSEAVNLIGRNYNVTIELVAALEKCEFTSNFDKNSRIEDVFAAMERILPVKITKKGKGVYHIDGENCK